MITWQDRRGAIAFGRVSANFFGRRALGHLKAAFEDHYENGARAILFDLSDVSTIRAHGAAVLLEAVVSAPPDMPIGFYGASDQMRAVFAETAVDRVLRLFPSRVAALKAPEFARLRLSDVRAVVLTAGKGSRIAPLSETQPKPMLDILGTPILGHILHQLGRAGLRDVVTNPGYLAPQITQYVSGQPIQDLPVFCAPEGAWRNGDWVDAPLGSASTLSRLMHEYGAITGETLVLCGDALLSIDFADLIETHRQSGADVTIAAKQVPDQLTHKYGILDVNASGRIQMFQERPALGTACSNLANIGVYVLSPAAVGAIPGMDNLDIGGDLFPALLAQGAHLQVFDAVAAWEDVGCAKDYFATTAKALHGDIPNLAPLNVRQQGQMRFHPEAHVSAGAALEGAIYVAKGAEIRKGAKIVGPSVIGADCVVEGGSDIRNSMIQEGTRVRKGAIVHNMIASGTWAIDHRFADGSLQARDPLDGVVSKSRQVSLELQGQNDFAMLQNSKVKRTG